MHIPDGYLGPPSCLAGYLFSAAAGSVAVRKVQKSLEPKKIPLLALAAAFSFVVMMFNIPLPGGSTGHATGGLVVAIAVGPWSAFLAISVALIIQALLFGDGGVTTLGMNCFVLALLMPTVSHGVYRLLSRRRHTPRGNAVASGFAAWFGLNVAALFTAVVFGLQPLLHHDASGKPLYSPYPFSVTISALMGGHLVLFGVIEGLITACIVFFLLRSQHSVIEA